MTTYKDAQELSKLTLGKPTDYCNKYNPDLLQAVPRSLNRNKLALTNTTLPFKGEDVWYGYELSWLNMKGKPVVAVAEFRFPCTSPNIVESKSFKLYLNSFNQSKFISIQDVTHKLSHDLAITSGAETTVNLYPVDNCPALQISSPKAICIDELDISIDNYNLNADILKQENSKVEDLQDNNNIIEESLVSHLLKSNCLITNQPDWASIYIEYNGIAINHEKILKYLISFRQHNEFHEQCVERIFCDLLKYNQLENLTVFARYTRRGGLDINPYRSNISSSAPFCRTLRQ
ncbi:MAG: NADPH-dependent 7-cyano-7-deazaguanine reductase QueF [Alteromonadaceae bacterium]|nr:NADPH-dependent 7-cyano-7-deazaguanine reductase QueF [Alteromonadaceae bacterium]